MEVGNMIHVVMILFLVLQTEQLPQNQSVAEEVTLAVSKADRIVAGTVMNVTEKMERMSLDGIESPFLTLTVHFKDFEVIKGKQSQKTIRQYASFARYWKPGTRVVIFLGERTLLNYDPVLFVENVKSESYLDQIRRIANELRK